MCYIFQALWVEYRYISDSNGELEMKAPVDAGYTQIENEPIVVQVAGCSCVDHAKHRLAAATDEIHNQAVEFQFMK